MKIGSTDSGLSGLTRRWLWLALTAASWLVAPVRAEDVKVISREQALLEKGGSYQQPVVRQQRGSYRNVWELSAGRYDERSAGPGVAVGREVDEGRIPPVKRDGLDADEIYQRNVTDADARAGASGKQQSSRVVDKQDRPAGQARPGSGPEKPVSADRQRSSATAPARMVISRENAHEPVRAAPERPAIEAASSGLAGSPEVLVSDKPVVHSDQHRTASADTSSAVVPSTKSVKSTPASIEAGAVRDVRPDTAEARMSQSGFSAVAVAGPDARQSALLALPASPSSKPVPSVSQAAVQPPAIKANNPEVSEVLASPASAVATIPLQGTLQSVPMAPVAVSSSTRLAALGALESRRAGAALSVADKAKTIRYVNQFDSGPASSFETWMTSEIDRFLQESAQGGVEVKVDSGVKTTRNGAEPSDSSALSADGVMPGKPSTVPADSHLLTMPGASISQVDPQRGISPAGSAESAESEMPGPKQPEDSDDLVDRYLAIGVDTPTLSVSASGSAKMSEASPPEPGAAVVAPLVASAPQAVDLTPPRIEIPALAPVPPISGPYGLFDDSYVRSGTRSPDGVLEDFVAWQPAAGQSDYLGSLKAVLDYSVDPGTGAYGRVLGLRWDLLGNGLRASGKQQARDQLDIEIEQLGAMVNLHQRARVSFEQRMAAVQATVQQQILLQQAAVLEDWLQRKQKQLDAGLITRHDFNQVKLQRDNTQGQLQLLQKLPASGISGNEQALLNGLEGRLLVDVTALNERLQANSLELRQGQRQLERNGVVPDYWDQVALRLYVENRHDAQVDNEQVVGVRAELPLGNSSGTSLANARKHSVQVRLNAARQQLQEQLEGRYRDFESQIADIRRYQREGLLARTRLKELQTLRDAGIGSLRLVREDEVEQLRLQELTLQQKVLSLRLGAYQALWDLGWMTNTSTEEVLADRQAYRADS